MKAHSFFVLNFYNIYTLKNAGFFLHKFGSYMDKTRFWVTVKIQLKKLQLKVKIEVGLKMLSKFYPNLGFALFRAGVPNPAPADRLFCTVHLQP